VAEDQVIDLTWGDVVQVAPDAASACRPGAQAFVVGLPSDGVVTTERCLTVEFMDGSDVEVPAGFLSLIERPDRGGE
jgi:hypothetical protein